MPNGRLSTTDGRFAATKERLAGLYLIDARDLNNTIQMASRNDYMVSPAFYDELERNQ